MRYFLRAALAWFLMAVLLSGSLPAAADESGAAVTEVSGTDGLTEDASLENENAAFYEAETSPESAGLSGNGAGDASETAETEAGGPGAETGNGGLTGESGNDGLAGESGEVGQTGDQAAASGDGELTEEADEVEEVTGDTEWTEDLLTACASAVDDGTDPETLLEGYIEACFNAALPEGASQKALMSRVYKDYNMSPVTSAALSALKPMIAQAAAGTRSGTAFYVTASQLGVTASQTVSASASWSAVGVVIDSFDFDVNLLLTALLLDCPYELYWFDKTDFRALTLNWDYTCSEVSKGKYRVTFKGATFTFVVADEYSAGLHQIDTSTGRTVQSAVSNAKAIVAKYQSYADPKKRLTAYKDEICSLTEYNDAAASGKFEYGNPWQLVWVFDRNPNTLVVCEGYAKAFEYLCNLTGFSNVNCYTVYGDCGGAHMWNIVTMDDGRNYIADITNCDNNKGYQPFLTGYVSGNMWDGYTFRVYSSRAEYVYDEDMWTVYTAKDLTLSAQAYGASVRTWSGTPAVRYEAKVKGEAQWTEKAWDGGQAGTIGQSRIMEAFTIQVTDSETDEPLDPDVLSVEYSGHVQNVGWESTVSNGGICGRPGKGLRIEAIRMRLTGELADQYDIYYCMHCQNYGWLAWAKDNVPAGTAGMALRVEAIRIKLVKKGSAAPANLGKWTKSFLFAPSLYCSSYVQGQGWQKEKAKGAISGTSGQSLRLEGLKVRISGEANLGVRYKSHIQNVGWEKEWKTDNEESGLPGTGRRMEAVKIELTGADKSKYDIYYCLHVQNFGWLGWAKNGEPAGSSGVSMRVEALVIKVLPKGSAAPGKYGSRSEAFVDGAGATSISLNKRSASVYVGGRVTLTASVLPANRTFKGVTWKSSNTSVASVSGGVVTGKKRGTAVITCTSNDGRVKASCTVVVK